MFINIGFASAIYCHLNNRWNNNGARERSGPVLHRLHYSQPVCVALINNTQIVGCMQMWQEWGRGNAENDIGIPTLLKKIILIQRGQFCMKCFIHILYVWFLSESAIISFYYKIYFVIAQIIVFFKVLLPGLINDLCSSKFIKSQGTIICVFDTLFKNI